MKINSLSEVNLSASETAPTSSLFDPAMLKQQAWHILARAERGESQHFEIGHTAVDAAVAKMAEALEATIRREAPPLVNCWFRLQEQFPDDLSTLAETLKRATDDERAKSGLDLALAAVLADPKALDDEAFVATLQDFMAGEFMADERGVPAIDAEGLSGDELPPASDRWRDELHTVLTGSPQFYGERGRFGDVLGALRDASVDRTVDAKYIYTRLGPTLQTLWTGPMRLRRRPAGDAWRAAELLGHDAIASFQAPILRLIESMDGPLSEAGLHLGGLHDLPVIADTGLINLLLALEIIVPKHSAVTRLNHPPGSDIIVECRCLAIALADRLCDHLTKRLDCTNRHLQPQRLRVPMFEVAAKSDTRIGLTVTTGLF